MPQKNTTTNPPKINNSLINQELHLHIKTRPNEEGSDAKIHKNVGEAKSKLMTNKIKFSLWWIFRQLRLNIKEPSKEDIH